jgi:hypothetical protein
MAADHRDVCGPDNDSNARFRVLRLLFRPEQLQRRRAGAHTAARRAGRLVDAARIPCSGRRRCDGDTRPASNQQACPSGSGSAARPTCGRRCDRGAQRGATTRLCRRDPLRSVGRRGSGGQGRGAPATAPAYSDSTQDSGDAHEQLAVPDAGWQPAVPDAGWQPAVPDAGWQLAVPDAGWQPAVPDAGWQPAVPDAGWQPAVLRSSYFAAWRFKTSS